LSVGESRRYRLRGRHRHEARGVVIEGHGEWEALGFGDLG